ncbi:type I-B CRISPR-associated protein Cas7/Cst2/DevR [Roseburia hominis]
MKQKALTLTVVANMTSNYSEGLGNIASVQKVFRNRKVYTIRSRESLKNALMVQAGMYDDLQTEVDGATQKLVTEELNAATCRALEGGYMSTKGTTYVRKSSVYLTDAISCESFVNETRFHNNLYLAGNFAEANGMNIQNDAGKVGLMPYQYEYDKSLKIYSLTIDLEMVGKDENFNAEASKEEKAERVKALLNAVETLSLVVKGNLDNAEPVFIVGGISDRKTHYFENVIHVEEDKLVVSQDLKDKIGQGYHCGLLRGKMLANEQEIEKELEPETIPAFFGILKDEVNAYYEV